MEIKIKRDGNNLGISESAWKAALDSAAADPSVGIKHAEIRGDEVYRIHVASIPEQVGCHFHRHGDEDYSVVAGSGILHLGKVSNLAGRPQVNAGDWLRIPVTAGDSFVIPEGYAHQLRKSGTDNLVILFGCPDSHIDDSKDRSLLPDAPN